MTNNPLQDYNCNHQLAAERNQSANYEDSIIIVMEHDQVASDSKKRLISLSEAAEIYDFNNDYLGQLARRGRLKAQKIGNSWVTTPNYVEDFIRSRKQKGLFRKDIQIS
ncbi:MAG: helix-turn-helix domain-containing protein [Candidatus Promineifilaceae bacterium]